jgi:hypothetical protein
VSPLVSVLVSPPVVPAVSEAAPPPGLALVLVTGVLAFALTAVPGAWGRTRHVVTIVHEAAHGMAAFATGRRVSGIRLHRDTSGVTFWKGRDRGPGSVLTVLAGYLGPAAVGLGAALVLSEGYAVGMLWALLLLLALMLLQIRNLFGLWSVLLAGTVLVVVTKWAPAELQQLVAYVVTWFLLLAAPRTIVELHRSRRGGRDTTSDAAQLARLTHLPGLLWVGFFLAATLGCLLVGGRLLVASAG